MITIGFKTPLSSHTDVRRYLRAIIPICRMHLYWCRHSRHHWLVGPVFIGQHVLVLRDEANDVFVFINASNLVHYATHYSR